MVTIQCPSYWESTYTITTDTGDVRNETGFVTEQYTINLSPGLYWLNMFDTWGDGWRSNCGIDILDPDGVSYYVKYGGRQTVPRDTTNYSSHKRSVEFEVKPRE